MNELNKARVVTAAIILFCAGAWLGHLATRSDLRAVAIKAGVAEYRVNPKTGETSFHFITREGSK